MWTVRLVAEDLSRQPPSRGTGRSRLVVGQILFGEVQGDTGLHVEHRPVVGLEEPGLRLGGPSFVGQVDERVAISRGVLLPAERHGGAPYWSDTVPATNNVNSPPRRVMSRARWTLVGGVAILSRPCAARIATIARLAPPVSVV